MNQRGFTLLEVLVATLIMAIAVTGLLSALSTSLQNAARLTSYDRAVLLGRQKMDELLIAVQAPKMTPFEGVWDPSLTGNEQTGWRALITPFDRLPKSPPGTPVLERVQLEVWWMSGGERKSFTLEGYRKGVLTPEEAGLP